MKWHRIWAVTLRHLRQFTRDFNDISSTFVVPFINLLVFGYMGIWMAGAANNPTIKLQLLSGIMVLQLINRSSVSSALSFFEELKSHNVTNLFSTPISIHEWLIASCIKALITCIMLLIFFVFCIYFIFGINILAGGVGLLLILFLAFMSSICLGFLAITVLLMWGMNANSIIWMLAWVVMVVSGALYPIAVMPPFLQVCAHYLPFLDLFSALRILITTNTIAWNCILRSVLFNGIYLFSSYALLLFTFKVSSRRGLERLMD
jgi:ABC-2 type transport system permease protein